MSTPFDRKLARFNRMMATTQAAYSAMYEAARRCADPKTSAALAAQAYRIQTCHRAARIIVHRPAEDAPWVQVTTPSACMSAWCMLCARNRARRHRRAIQHRLLAIRRNHPAIRGSILTLTSRNRGISETRAMLADHLAGMDRYFARKEVARSHHGALHAVELAVRGGGREIGVHSHHLLLVDDACMAPGRYLKIQRILELWAEALRITDYTPICDIRAVKPGPDGDIHDALADSISETAKYCLKPLSLLSERPRDLFGTSRTPSLFIDPDVVLHVAPALKGRRLLRMSGLWVSAITNTDASPASDAIPTDRRDFQPEHERSQP